MVKCKYYDKCNAPICPLDRDSIENGIWYSQEPICKNPEFSDNIVIRNMKTISKIDKSGETWYNYEMLNNELNFNGAIKGFSPDSIDKESIQKWIRKYTIKKTISKVEYNTNVASTIYEIRSGSIIAEGGK